MTSSLGTREADGAPALLTTCGGIEFHNPVLTASGTFGYGQEFDSLLSLRGLGGLVTKGISPLPRLGNPPPRICETAAGMLNSIGLENVGVEGFAREKLPFLRTCGTRVLVNFFGTTFDEYVDAMRGEVPFLDFAPFVSISAKTGQRVGHVLELAVDVWGERRKRIPTPELNRIIGAATLRQAPPAGKLGPPKIFYTTQVAVAPPTFVFFARHANQVHFSYRRFLENQLRAEFGFDGTPIRLIFRERASGRAVGSDGRGRGGHGVSRPRTATAGRSGRSGSGTGPVGKQARKGTSTSKRSPSGRRNPQH